MDERDQLAKLVMKGKVFRRDGLYELRHPDVANPFIADIQRRIIRLRSSGTIRPNKNKRKR